jgi:micrococcal nuclease
MIEEGYAHEYTYNTPYKYQAEYKKAQKVAEASKAGLWSDSACKGLATPVTTTSSLTQPKDSSCTIKGNIGTTGEKIYHIIGCGSYAKTQINESQGEKWFCSESEAQTAGWRKAKNCP